jgi:RHS repeat-associated protein
MNKRAARSRHPVIIATGEKSLDQLDFQLPGPIELEWRRQYRSGDARTDGWFGQGWSHPLSTELWVEEDVLRYWDEQGREVVLPAVAVGEEHFEAYEQFTLIRPEVNRWALRHNQGLTHHFRQHHPAQWRLLLEVVQDRNRRRVVLQFNQENFGARFRAHATPPRPQSLIDSAGRTLYFEWTDQGQLSQVKVESEGSNIVLASYRFGSSSPTGDGLPDLLSHTDANGHSRTFVWDQHMLVGYTIATGQRFSNRYDRLTAAGKVTESLALDDGTGNWFEYIGRTTRMRDRLGRETVFVQNARQDIVAVHDAQGNVTRNFFDEQGRPESRTDPLGRTSSTTFDHRGNPTLSVDEVGNATKVEYNHLNLPTKWTDAMGSVWHRQYDKRGNLISKTDPLGHTTHYEVDAAGQVTAIIDALDKRSTLQWDEAGNVVAYIDCSGQTSRQVYDSLGHMVSSTDALGRRTDYVLNASGQLLQEIQPDGAKYSYNWDGQGNLIRFVDPLGQTTTWEYNGAGTPLMRTDPLGNTLGFRYDHGGRLVALTNEVGAVMRLEYDLMDRLTDELGFDGRHQRYVYNAAGELTHVIERGGSDFGPGKVTRFERDALGRMLAKHHVGEAQGQFASARFAYDALGRLTRASNAIADVRLFHDPLGRLLSETQASSDFIGAKVYESKHRYDALGNRIQTVLPNGRTLNYLFYGSGQLHQVTLDGEVVSDFERDALHREVIRTQGQLQSSFTYDSAGRLGHYKVSLASNRTSARFDGSIERHYRYDVAGQVVEWLDRHRGPSRYRYDSSGRIIRSEIGVPDVRGTLENRTDGPANSAHSDEQFQWDAASNLLASDTLGAPDSAVSFVPGNRLLLWHNCFYAYDEHGNMTERLRGKRGSSTSTTTRFTWDDANQLISVHVSHGPQEDESGRSFSFCYDALGRRISKTDASGTTNFAWDGDRLVLKQRGADETVLFYQLASFVPLAQMHNGGLYHLHTDHLGTPLEATDGAGNISWRATYSAWGNVLIEEVAGLEQNLRFQGQYFDAGTGLHYNRFRYFDPEIGRYLSQDPIGLRGGTNSFQYVPNPIMWIDPFGLAWRKPNQANRPADCKKWSLEDSDRECKGHVPGVGFANYRRKTGTERWYSVDLTGHGGSAFKMFDRSGDILNHVADLDSFGDIMPKHKSEVGKQVDLNKLKCKDISGK